MKIAFISKKNSTQILELQKKAEERGHVFDLVDLNDILISSLNSSDAISSLGKYDLIHYQASVGHVMTPILTEWLSTKNIPVVNNRYNLLPFFEDKRYQVFRCASAGITTPRTYLSATKEFEDIDRLLGTPFILKGAVSAQGKHVFLINNKSEFDEVIEQCEKPLFQEYIPSRADYRVHRIGNDLPIIYKRCASGEDFRSNVSRGGTIEPITDTDEREKLASFARLASDAMEMEYGGIDIMKHPENEQLYFIESNRNPGWAQVNDLLGINTEDHILDFYEQKIAA
ncbi:MAG: ATP-grasp domain-containing protein [Candidatus Paceibacterota bacterium]